VCEKEEESGEDEPDCQPNRHLDKALCRSEAARVSRGAVGAVRAGELEKTAVRKTGRQLDEDTLYREQCMSVCVVLKGKKVRRKCGSATS
jgi:hypothetical protein